MQGLRKGNLRVQPEDLVFSLGHFLLGNLGMVAHATAPEQIMCVITCQRNCEDRCG